MQNTRSLRGRGKSVRKRRLQPRAGPALCQAYERSWGRGDLCLGVTRTPRRGRCGFLRGDAGPKGAGHHQRGLHPRRFRDRSTSRDGDYHAQHPPHRGFRRGGSGSCAANRGGSNYGHAAPHRRQGTAVHGGLDSLRAAFRCPKPLLDHDLDGYEVAICSIRSVRARSSGTPTQRMWDTRL